MTAARAGRRPVSKAIGDYEIAVSPEADPFIHPNSDPMEQPCYDEIDGTFRGWVCHSCNLIIGHAHDDAARLRKIADYVEAAVLAKAAQMRRARRRKKA